MSYRCKFPLLSLPPNDRIEADVLAHKLRRQSQQIADAAVDHTDATVPIHHDDALAHVLQGGGQPVLIAGKAPTMDCQDDADTQHKGREPDASPDILKTMLTIRGEHLVGAIADQDDERVVGKTTVADYSRSFGHLGDGKLIVAVPGQRGSFEQWRIGQRPADQSRNRPPSADIAIQSHQHDEAAADLKRLVEARKIGGIQRRDDHTEELAVKAIDPPGELHGVAV